MEEAYLSLAAGKIRELLLICGIGDCNDEPIKQHIIGISHFVRARRLQLGITDPPPLPTPKSIPNLEAMRGSYQLLPTAEKRQRADYSRLDAPTHEKKRKKRTKSKKAESTREPERRQGGTVVAREEATSAEISSTIDTNTALSTPRAGTPFIVENIIVNYLKINDPLGRYGHLATQVTMTASVRKTQSYVDDIVKLQCLDAVQLIKQENALSTSKGIQSRFNETVYWDIIMKGSELLDPKELPIPKGPLGEFTMAEKFATRRFMMEAGYGLSAANQRQCRLFQKRLFEMRNAGVDKVLLYRPKKFDLFCKSFSSEHGTDLVEIEEKYGCHIKQLEERVVEESKGDLTRGVKYIGIAIWGERGQITMKNTIRHKNIERT
ncbi:hypothetical protein N7491_011230 [Penicillium cf. griseofulvum]|uniref:Uncharacterized protein n=1 Tax=Penicillium cf. griseofulvum TaxID=2972120 RepID=A0A9W9T6J9_9EURO|nr:hypothetical protein N7472_001551 [Penicillium cf. griseofulvum]KAJ5422785.1 hypothetical protein N7491_011230 [Penicillium cf. griseofulvum]KAJ5428965.1 hypothetical protein N7445_010419 [Penicillium cf. griseofulvum]